MKTLVCIDRDGTLIYDNKYHLGSQDNWKDLVSILPKVVKGIKLLKTIPNVYLYMITNQPGVAVKEFPLLTLERAHEVCKYVLKRLEEHGAKLDDYFLCPHASFEYANKRDKYKFEKKLVCNCDCIKPRLGMVFDALKKEGITRENSNVFVIGDRATDVQTALNIQGKGILIPFENEPYEKDKIKEGYIAKDFLDAANYVIKNEYRN